MCWSAGEIQGDEPDEWSAPTGSNRYCSYSEEEEEDSAHHLMHEIWQTRMCLNMQRQLTQILLRPKPWFKLVCSNVVDLKRYFVFIHCPVRSLLKPEPHQPLFTSKNKCSDKQMRKTKNNKIKELPMKILH